MIFLRAECTRLCTAALILYGIECARSSLCYQSNFLSICMYMYHGWIQFTSTQICVYMCMCSRIMLLVLLAGKRRCLVAASAHDVVVVHSSVRPGLFSSSARCALCACSSRERVLFYFLRLRAARNVCVAFSFCCA